jgi:hypothetical protein
VSHRDRLMADFPETTWVTSSYQLWITHDDEAQLP